MQEFVFKGVTFVVRRDASGNLVYRDRVHAGGPWSVAEASLKHTSLHPTFRRRLGDACRVLQAAEKVS